jgi:heme exporter protein CcmD
MNSDPYFGFILAAYLVGFAVITGMIIVTLLDYRNLKRALARLSARTGRSVDQ